MFWIIVLKNIFVFVFFGVFGVFGFGVGFVIEFLFEVYDDV